MATVQTLKRTEYEWLLSGDKITSEALYADFHEIDKLIDTFSLSINCNGTINSVSPLILYDYLVWQKTYDILTSKENKLETFIAKTISKISEVEYIIISKKDNYYEIWTVINKLDRELRDKIYYVEYNILQLFRELYFDFHVICKDGKSINDIMPTNSIIFYRKTA